MNGAAGWSPISQDPFSSTPINAIATGLIGSTQYWVIVGNAGRLATSIDGGLNWVLQSSGTTEDINDVAYNPDDESFLAVADAGEYTHSTDGTTWTADASKFAALPEAAGGSFDIKTCCYDIGGQGFRAMWNFSGANEANAYTTDDTATWDSTPNSGTEVNLTTGKMKNLDSIFGDIGTIYSNGQDTYTFDIIPDETGSVTVNLSGQDVVSALLGFSAAGTSRLYNGHADGRIYLSTSLLDGTTFGVSGIREFALSSTHQRIVAVADDGKIGYIDQASYAAGPFVLVANGSNPLANFAGLAWNDTDGLFIAVNDAGQILRSTNGIA
ncbi:MAG: hypothetical protein E4H01_13740 [Lysobacterales bacterium]|nr:MAG: hypothetical protein E4H01_13740 [Xanthomonadales bacterium]